MTRSDELKLLKEIVQRDDEIERLRAALETIAADMKLGDSLHAICNRHIQTARAALRETQERQDDA